MTKSPEQVIREYLDEHGGESTATVRHLLDTFGIDAGDHAGRDRIRTVLSQAGVEVDPPLGFLGVEEQVRLSTETVQSGDYVRDSGDRPAPFPLPSTSQLPLGGSRSDSHRDTPAPDQQGEGYRGKGDEPATPQDIAPPSASPRVGASQHAKPKPWYRRSWAIAVGVVLLVALAGVAVLALQDDEGGSGQEASDVREGPEPPDARQVSEIRDAFLVVTVECLDPNPSTSKMADSVDILVEAFRAHASEPFKVASNRPPTTMRSLLQDSRDQLRNCEAAGVLPSAGSLADDIDVELNR